MRTRNQIVTALAMTAVGLFGIGLTTTATAAEDSTATARATETVDGRITKVDFEKKTFTLLVKAAPDGQEAKTVTISWNEKTECLLDGKTASAKESIKPGLETTVTHDEMTAIRVESKTPKPE